ncbi:E-selectin-like [Macrobrachium nipponense]|uniref:E-selectin-like n=1 Tax=Macrobrachium nipponense TaxID=159736 RepID=UPI0030C85891
MAGVSNGSQFYRYMTVGTNKGDRVAMAPADYIVAAPGVTIKYAVCQLYGPDECLDGPPPASANMTLEWDNSTAFGATANYRCVRGYFMDETTLQKVQTVECRGHLGGWVAPEYELFNCTLVEVCNESSLPCAGSPLLGLTVSPDFLTLDSSIVYSCPPGMQMPGFLTTMNASCTDDTSTDPVTYKFSPSAISDCNICAQAVNVTNATTTWVQGTIYTVGQKVNVQCIQNHLMKTMYGTEYSNVTIACTYFGWWLPPGGLTCVPACAGDPPAPGANMSIPTIKEREVGANLKYSCDAGLYIPAALPNITNHTTIRCNESLLWEPVSLVVADLLCTQMCLSDPFMPVSPANTTWDRIARVAGTTINITCPEGFAFPDFNNTIVLTCGVDGNWTEVVPENAFCRRYTMEAPVTPNGSVYDGPSPPHWESTILDFTCPENLMSRDGLNSTWTIFNGTVWEPFDPEFACLNVCGDPIPAVSPVDDDELY